MSISTLLHRLASTIVVAAFVLSILPTFADAPVELNPQPLPPIAMVAD